jgi:hypothetical protein
MLIVDAPVYSLGLTERFSNLVAARRKRNAGSAARSFDQSGTPPVVPYA